MTNPGQSPPETRRLSRESEVIPLKIQYATSRWAADNVESTNHHDTLTHVSHMSANKTPLNSHDLRLTSLQARARCPATLESCTVPLPTRPGPHLLGHCFPTLPGHRRRVDVPVPVEGSTHETGQRPRGISFAEAVVWSGYNTSTSRRDILSHTVLKACGM